MSKKDKIVTAGVSLSISREVKLAMPKNYTEQDLEDAFFEQYSLPPTTGWTIDDFVITE
jgi:hypothetical protein